MSRNTSNDNEELLSYQTQRLQDLINEILLCCEDRKLYEHKKFGLAHAELKCLRLFDRVRYLTVKDMAQKLEVAKSRVTKLVNGLINKGMVHQIDDPKDGRIKLISLTRAGGKKSEEIGIFLHGIHRDILLQMTADERKKLISQLDMLRSAMESVKGNLV